MKHLQRELADLVIQRDRVSRASAKFPVHTGSCNSVCIVPIACYATRACESESISLQCRLERLIFFFSNISDGRNFSSSGTAIPFYFSANVWLNREMREGGIWFKG